MSSRPARSRRPDRSPKAFKLPAALSLAAEKQPEKLRDRRIIFIRAALVKRERLERVVVRIIARQEHRTVYEQLGKHMVIAQQILQDRLQLFNILKLLRGKIGRRSGLLSGVVSETGGASDGVSEGSADAAPDGAETTPGSDPLSASSLLWEAVMMRKYTVKIIKML